MVVDGAGIVAAAVLAGLAVLHVAWAAGGRWGATAVVPTADGRPVLAPSTRATLVVALLLVVSAGLVIGAVSGWPPHLVFRLGGVGVALVLLARSIGEFRYVGFLKQVRGTPFARRDSSLYSPLCLALGVAVGLVAAR